MSRFKLKSVLFIGNYDEEYSRNAIFIKGLRKNKIIVHEFNIKSYNIIKNGLICLKNFKRLNSMNYDLILLHAPNNIQVLFAKLLSKIKQIPLVHDIYISKLQTFYYDRDLVGKTKMPRIFYKFFYYLQDFFECAISDHIILDTYSHIQYFNHKYNIRLVKFSRVFIGAQEDNFFPRKKTTIQDDKFLIGFWGTFIPLQGIKYIIEAAKILENDIKVRFILIGDGQTFKISKLLAEKLQLKNIVFKGFIPLRELPEHISSFDIGLGIFGDTPKTVQVIPNKVFEGNAMKLPMISCDSSAIRELFTHEKDIFLCKRANSESIANAILTMKNNDDLREKIKKNAYDIFTKFCSINALAFRLIEILEKILNQY
ncbi:MAG: glycosyltransferase [Candidatus Lokiarchaeota archaeon]|nr:glycosyltransferase [Candidatus Lokiarchaeota archaeon]